MKPIILFFLLTVSAFAQCDTIAPSGKVLFHKDQSRVTLEIRSSDTVYAPCVVVKAFGCPTFGSEKTRAQVMARAEDSIRAELRRLRIEANKIGRDVSENLMRWPDTRIEGMGVTVCGDCSTLYAGRRRK